MACLIIRRVSYALNMVIARNRAIRGDYTRALDAIFAIYSTYGCEPPSNKVPPIVNIMCSLMSWNLRDSIMTFGACAIASDQLLAINSNNIRYMRNAEYLIYYCKYLLQFAEYDFESSRDHDFSKLRRYRRGSIDVTKVDRLLRETFPIDREWFESEWGMGAGG